jgi:hypothetical protein
MESRLLGDPPSNCQRTDFSSRQVAALKPIGPWAIRFNNRVIYSLAS